MQAFLHQLFVSTNHAANIGRGRPMLHIAGLELVQAHNVYGYSPSSQFFVKVKLLSSYMARKIANLLESGAVMGTQFQPFEVPFLHIHRLLLTSNLYSFTSRIRSSSSWTTIYMEWTSCVCRATRFVGRTRPARRSRHPKHGAT